MATTTNLGLTTYDTASGSATTFLTFRLALAGNSSNMSILDAWAGDVSASIVAIESNLLVTVNASLISTNYYEATVSAIGSYVTNSMISLKLNVANTGAVTLNINSLGIKSLKKINYDGELTDLESGDIKENRRTLFFYDGTYYVLMGATTADQVAIYGNENNILTISASGIMQDSGVSASSVLLEISGSGIMSDSSGSVIKHNSAGITSGSYNRVTVSTLGHVISGSQINYQTVSSISGSGVMSTTTGSSVKHNFSGITAGSYVKVQVDSYGHIISGSTKMGDASFILSTKTEDYELTTSDYICLASGSVTITLPSATGISGKMFVVKNINETGSGSNIIIISGSGNIDTGSQIELSELEKTTLVSDDLDWWTI